MPASALRKHREGERWSVLFSAVSVHLAQWLTHGSPSIITYWINNLKERERERAKKRRKERKKGRQRKLSRVCGIADVIYLKGPHVGEQTLLGVRRTTTSRNRRLRDNRCTVKQAGIQILNPSLTRYVTMASYLTSLSLSVPGNGSNTKNQLCHVTVDRITLQSCSVVVVTSFNLHYMLLTYCILLVGCSHYSMFSQ